jgi:hypothetical protein
VLLQAPHAGCDIPSPQMYGAGNLLDPDVYSVLLPADMADDEMMQGELIVLERVECACEFCGDGRATCPRCDFRRRPLAAQLCSVVADYVPTMSPGDWAMDDSDGPHGADCAQDEHDDDPGGCDSEADDAEAQADADAANDSGSGGGSDGGSGSDSGSDSDSRADADEM